MEHPFTASGRGFVSVFCFQWVLLDQASGYERSSSEGLRDK